MISELKLKEYKEKSAALISLVLSNRQLCDIELIMNGGFSPLDGFLSKSDYNSVISDMRLENGEIWPMPIVLDLVHKNFTKYKNLILFMGKSGKKILSQTLKDWDFEYKEKRSLTSDDSFLLSIKNIKKKN